MIVEQHLQNMLGRELLVPLAGGEGLRALDKTAGAFGVFLEIHAVSLSTLKRALVSDAPSVTFSAPCGGLSNDMGEALRG